MRLGFNSKQDIGEDQGPRKGVIKALPLLALEKGYLVLVLDHEFSDLPSWVKWNPEDQIMGISQMNGDIDEVRVVINQEYIDKLVQTKKILLVSRKGEEKISHFVAFVA